MQRVQRFILRWDGRVSEISWLELGVLLEATSIVSLTFIQNRLRDAHKGQFVLAEVVVVQLLEIYQSVSSDPPLCVCVAVLSFPQVLIHTYSVCSLVSTEHCWTRLGEESSVVLVVSTTRFVSVTHWTLSLRAVSCTRWRRFNWRLICFLSQHHMNIFTFISWWCSNCGLGVRTRLA